MDLPVFLAVLVAAAFHASWNALIKLRLEPMTAMALISVFCGVVTVPLIPLTGMPAAPAWPYLIASLVIHLGYYTALAEAYRHGDLGQIYPIARGSAPLLTAIGAFVWLGEDPGPVGWGGIAMLGFGVVLLSVRGGRATGRYHGRAVAFALLTAITIALYTLADGQGARLAGSVGAYIVWLFVLDGLMMLAFGLIQAPGLFWDGLKTSWGLVLVGGALSTAAYAIAIWAMTKAPIALVAGLRETSVLFAAIIGVVLLKEPLVPLRILAALLVVAGALLLRLR